MPFSNTQSKGKTIAENCIKKVVCISFLYYAIFSEHTCKGTLSKDHSRITHNAVFKHLDPSLKTFSSILHKIPKYTSHAWLYPCPPTPHPHGDGGHSTVCWSINLARRSEFCVLVAKTIPHKWAKRASEILFLPRDHKIHIFEPTCSVLFIKWTKTTVANQKLNLEHIAYRHLQLGCWNLNVSPFFYL